MRSSLERQEGPYVRTHRGNLQCICVPGGRKPPKPSLEGPRPERAWESRQVLRRESWVGGGGACSLQITWINLKQGFLSASYKEMSQEVVSKYFQLLFAQEMP